MRKPEVRTLVMSPWVAWSAPICRASGSRLTARRARRGSRSCQRTGSLRRSCGARYCVGVPPRAGGSRRTWTSADSAVSNPILDGMSAILADASDRFYRTEVIFPNSRAIAAPHQASRGNRSAERNGLVLALSAAHQGEVGALVAQAHLAAGAAAVDLDEICTRPGAMGAAGIDGWTAAQVDTRLGGKRTEHREPRGAGEGRISGRDLHPSDEICIRRWRSASQGAVSRPADSSVQPATWCGRSPKVVNQDGQMPLATGPLVRLPRPLRPGSRAPGPCTARPEFAWRDQSISPIRR